MQWLKKMNLRASGRKDMTNREYFLYMNVWKYAKADIKSNFTNFTIEKTICDVVMLSLETECANCRNKKLYVMLSVETKNNILTFKNYVSKKWDGEFGSRTQEPGTIKTEAFKTRQGGDIFE